jgi:hypothetical protein
MKKITLATLFLVLISLNSLGQCNFDYTYSIDTANNQITFNNISTTSTIGGLYMYPDVVNGSPFTYNISNNFITNNSSIITYNDGDTYVEVCMQTSNSSNGCSDTICKTIYLPNPCGYTLNIGITDNMDGTVTYTNTNLNNILFETGVTNTQDFSINILPGQSITHNYNSYGTFPYLIRVEDSSGTINCIDTNVREVRTYRQSTSNCNLERDFYANPSTSDNLSYSFGLNDSSNTCSFYWNFYDNNSYSQSSAPVYTYTQPGEYIVCLAIGACDSVCYDTICKRVTVGYSSINELDYDNVIINKLYPNPTLGITNISLTSVINSEIETSIINLSGKLISQKKNSVIPGENKIQIETKDLTNGFYIILMRNEEGLNSSLRLIKR